MSVTVDGPMDHLRDATGHYFKKKYIFFYNQNRQKKLRESSNHLPIQHQNSKLTANQTIKK